ncbi:hypothetical protein BGZ91_004176 [Linnemannia elongata]|nr:hypothetical protein BGZ91_004176 [Linnemannia elongata]
MAQATNQTFSTPSVKFASGAKRSGQLNIAGSIETLSSLVACQCTRRGCNDMGLHNWHRCASEPGFKTENIMRENAIVHPQSAKDFIKYYSELCQRANDLKMVMDIAVDQEPHEVKKNEIIHQKDSTSLVSWSKEACAPFDENCERLGDKLPIPIAPVGSDPRTNPCTKPNTWKLTLLTESS